MEKILIECGFKKLQYGNFSKEGFRYLISHDESTICIYEEDKSGVVFRNIYTKQDLSDLLRLIG